ncbi:MULTISPECIES: tyrosine-type recombinase/integrase [Sphingobium]|uniref:tyrosine-type recombinase/integrase n=1 Tax=Sphingobium TaxID=165695 RepID=UPI000C36D2F3|nr:MULTISPECIES: integrase arm-type DNA-binding domain-containing protein [Sphingobium]MAX15781.1 integrase [Sphingobium sp.]MBS50814.1 integrase [Sphingobium sp.]MCC4257648.1 tyrosine-type recombinase/integrase [Sphingobium lactosutens]HCW61043.1 integrase [Sphingobium sp.]
MPLTDLAIRALDTQDKVYKRADDRGLYLEVHPTGSKLWRYKYRHQGKDKRLALGRYPEVGLAEARRKRDEARLKVVEGIDPLAERRRKKLVAAYHAANTFGDVAKEYIDKMVAEERALATITKANWLLEQLEPIAKFPLIELKPMDVFAALKRIEARGKYETARRCRSFASRVFRYGVATGRAESDPTAVLRGALITPKPKHHGALLEPEEVGELLRAIDAYVGTGITRIAMQIAPHMMARPGELRKATWSEFDLENAVWKVPADRMKMRRPHVVPLSRQVLAMLFELHALTGPNGYVFPANHTWKRPLSENTMNQAFRRMGYTAGEITAHGLRTTASTLLNESGKWSPDAIERSLAHSDKDAVRGIYNRGRYWQERVAMHQWWSDYLDELRSSVPATLRGSVAAE